MEQILHYATIHGYTAYTSTLLEAWRASISGLTESIALWMDGDTENDLELGINTDFSQDPVTRFGLTQARRHRDRGTSLAMFLGLFIYYRQAYQDCLHGFLPAGPERDKAEHTVVRLFDRMGTAFCVAWANEGESATMNDMAATLRSMTNEKNRYLTFLESLASPVIFLTQEGRVENINHAAVSLITGESRPGQIYYENRMKPQAETVLGRPVGELIPWLGDFAQASLDNMEGAHCRWATLIHARAGKTFRAVICRQPDVSGKFEGFSLILHDETEQHATHRQIGLAKEELERTFDTISDLVYLVDTSYVLRRVNKALAQRLGLPFTDIIGRTCQETLGCAQCTCIDSSFSVDSAPMSYPNITGRFLLSRNTLIGASGEIFGFVFVARDVTHLELIQASLDAAENNYRSIFDNAQEGIFQSTPDGTYLSLNSSMSRIFGFDSKEEMQKYYTDITAQMYVHPEDRNAIFRECEREPLAKEYVANREVQLKRRDGSIFWAQVGGRLARDPATGKIQYFEGFVQDINERKKLESQLLQTQKLEAIGQLAAGIAHEINTPAQYVLNNMWFIKDGVEKIAQAVRNHGALFDELAGNPGLIQAIEQTQAVDQDLQLDFYLGELPAAIAETLQGLDRITAIVRSVKHFAHPGHDHVQTANLNELVQDTVNVSRNEWKYVADLSTDLDSSLPEIPCLIHEIGQVLLNLIINAAHAVAEKYAQTTNRGRIHVSTRLVGDWVEIRVQDDGAGIPLHAHDHIFEPFFTTKPVGKGTGQGLYLAHRTVVTLHEGRLDFETEEGQGTVFILALPVTGPSRRSDHGR